MKKTTDNTDNTATQEKWVAYYRVSTKRQGLGLEAQRSIVTEAAERYGAQIVAEVDEKESGKECERPGLNLALALARKNRATLVVAKHDRLTRDLAFASTLIFKSGIKFHILNFSPDAMTDPIIFGVEYGMAQRELTLISDRTKAALATLKAKGVKLGRPDAADSITREMIENSVEVRRRKADENQNNVAASNEIRRYLADNGNKRNLSAIARHLNAKGYYTSTGVFHTAQSVKLLCKRYAI